MNRKGQQATVGTKRRGKIVVGALDVTCRLCRCDVVRHYFLKKIFLCYPYSPNTGSLDFVDNDFASQKGSKSTRNDCELKT